MKTEFADEFLSLCTILEIDEDYASNEAKKRYNLPISTSFFDLTDEQILPLLKKMKKQVIIEEFLGELQKKLEGMKLDCGCLDGKECDDEEIKEHNKTIQEVLDILKDV